MSKPISRNLVNSILRNYVKVQDSEDEFYNWNWRRSYYNSITSSSVNRVQSHIDSKEPFFVMGVRRDLEINKWIKEDWGEAENLTREEEDVLIEIAREQMEVEIVELKETLLDYGLGFIPLKGVYKAKDSNFSLGVEMSVFVPMSPNFTGYEFYPERNSKIAKYFDFESLAIALARKYNQESVLMRMIAQNNSLGMLYQNGKFEEFKENIKRLTDEDVDMYMSQLNKSRDSDVWWTLKKVNLVSVVSSLYTRDELEILCG